VKAITYFSLGLLLFACQSKDNVNLVDTNCGPDLAVNSQLTFVFDKDLIPDSLTNSWDSTAFVEFTPAISGRYSWKSPTELLFVPRQNLDPSTTYQVHFTGALLQHTSYKLSPGLDFSFNTAPLQLKQLNAFWATNDGSDDPAQLHFRLAFNHAVDPSEALQYLKVNVDNKDRNIQLKEDDIAQQMQIVVTDLSPEDREYEATVTVDKGLKPFKGADGTSEELLHDLKVASPYLIAVQDIQGEHDGVQGSVVIATSQQAQIKNIKQFITVAPAVKYEVTVDNRSITLASEDFDANKTYEIGIAKGLPGAIGGKTKYNTSQQISFGALNPSIQFLDRKAGYLSAQGFRNLAVRVINIDQVSVKVTKVYENNILKFVNSSQYYYDDVYGDYYQDYNYYNVQQLGDVVWQQEVNTDDLPRKGSSRLLNLDFEDQIGDFPGLYVVEIADPEQYWISSKKVMAISDLGLIAKAGENQVTVFVNSIKTALPQQGVSLTLRGINNQVIGRTVTDANGVAHFKKSDQSAPGFRPNMITAALDGDYNFLPFNKTRINSSRFEVGGTRINNTGYQAFIYAERDIYRPGETLNIAAMVRDYQWKVPDNLPLILKWIGPDGQVQSTSRKVIDQSGMIQAKLSLPREALTGTYLVQALTANEVLLNTYSLAVEEFIPDRIKVETKTDKDSYQLSEMLKINTKASNFFGPPAANRNYEVELSLNRKYFTSPQHANYTFQLTHDRQSFNQILRSGKTNSNGEFEERFELPTLYKNLGVLQADLFVTVFDETGRPVNRRVTADVFTQKVFFGLDPSGPYYHATNNPIKVPLIAVDHTGTALNGAKAQVQVIRHDYKTVLAKSGNYYRYRSERVEHVMQNKVQELQGTSNAVNFVPDRSGRYEVRISEPGARSYVSREFYVYSWGSTNLSSFQVNNEGQIDITFDQPQYEIGDIAKVLFKTPFSGRLLVTLERDQVQEYFYLDTDKRTAELSIPVKEDQVPNIYVTATLFKPHRQSELPLTVAHGFASMDVHDPQYTLPLTVDAASESRSRTTQTIKVKSVANSKVTVAVVDEGILQLTNFQTPDPLEFFFSKRALQVTSHDIYPYLFPEISQSALGGDGMNMQKRINPLTNKRVQLVSFWSGVLTTDSNGEAEFKIDIPQFSGNLRIMTAVADKDAFASTQAQMIVADPLVMSVALPRFLSPQDTLEVPVVVTNTTNKPANLKATISTKGPISVLGPTAQEVTGLAGSEQIIKFKIATPSQIGAGQVNVEIKALGEVFNNNTDITVRPIASLQKISGGGIAEAGKSTGVNFNSGDYISGTMDRKLIISKSPMVEFAEHLQYLVRYPHGCVEQTVSSAFPQLYFEDLSKALNNGQDQAQTTHYHINEAIKRLQLMQLYHGGLSYWPGRGTESWWGSAFAAHFLWEAKQLGYEVNDTMLSKLLDYLRKKLRDKKSVTYYFNGNQNRKIAPKEVAYSLFVLALADRPDRSTMNYYKSRTDRLSLDSRYLLSATYGIIGDSKKAKEVLPAAFEGEEANRVFSGSFYSFIRDEAISLYSLLKQDPNNLQIPLMAKHLSQTLKSKRWLNTQERVFAFLALGKLAQTTNSTSVKAQVTIDGKEVATFSGEDIILNTEQLSGNPELSVQGTGNLYYFWSQEGIPKGHNFSEEDQFLKVRRTFYDRNGSVVTNNRFKQNDLVVVKLSLESLQGSVENVVVTDMLPAGFEIENARIGEVAQFNWLKNRSVPEYQDIRDDRINMFTTATRTPKHYYYVVRAVSKGSYSLGPVAADAMYDAEYHSYHGSGQMVVE